MNASANGMVTLNIHSHPEPSSELSVSRRVSFMEMNIERKISQPRIFLSNQYSQIYSMRLSWIYVVPSIRHRLMNTVHFLRTWFHSHLKFIIISIIAVVVIISILSFTIPLVGTNQSVSVAVVNANSFDSTLTTRSI